MEIEEVSGKEYALTFQHPQVVYDRAEFAALNAGKVAAVRHLVIRGGGKPRLGLTVGVDADGGVRAPFSAPFAGLDFNREQSAETMAAAARALRAELPGMVWTLPPAAVYAPAMNSKTLLALLGAGATPHHTDWNHHMHLLPEADYRRALDSASRNKLLRAEESGAEFLKVNADPMRAYEVIGRNRRAKGYPLRMTAEQVMATARIVDVDFFVLALGGTDVAAAVVYHAAPQVAQVIYWGDDPQSPLRNSMNLLADRVFAHYHSLGFRTVDVGPSSSDGVASTGLCDFKESVGCTCSPKFTLRL